MRGRLPALLLLLALAAGCRGSAPPPTDGELLVFAASSLSEVLPEVAQGLREETGRELRFSFGSSAALARQARAGAPADLLVMADIPKTVQRGWRVHPLAANRLVVVYHDPRGECSGGHLHEKKRIAIGDWRADVPVGLRAREWLVADGRWETLQDKLLPCADARATVSAVLSGAADAGIVYRTDAWNVDGLLVSEFAPAEVSPTVYWAVEPLGRTSESEALLKAFRSARAQELFHGAGFEAVPDEL